MSRALLLIAPLVLISLVACSNGPTPPARVAGFAFPVIPGMDFSQWDSPPLDRKYDPGSFESLGALETSASSKGSNAYLVTASGLMDTDLTPEELVDLYWHGIVHASWNVTEEGVGDTVGWFTWTVRDEKDHQWYGSLVAVTAGDGWQRVSFVLHSSELR